VEIKIKLLKILTIGVETSVHNTGEIIRLVTGVKVDLALCLRTIL
jgi:hypothetical protein